eukprot:COSAG02_NODE_6856_length_3324_cov_155.239070_1_plen_96_part_10
MAQRGLAAPHPAADGAAGAGGGEHWGGCILAIPSYRQANRHERQRGREAERQSGGEAERLAESVCVCAARGRAAAPRRRPPGGERPRIQSDLCLCF